MLGSNPVPVCAKQDLYHYSLKHFEMCFKIESVREKNKHSLSLSCQETNAFENVATTVREWERLQHRAT